MVDAHLARAGVGVRELGRQVRDEVARLSGALLAGRHVRQREVVERERVRRQGVLVDEPARVERRVVEHRVDAGAALDDDRLPGVGEAAADADGQQHADERGVEDEVAGLAEVAALGRDRERPAAVVPRDAVAGLAQLLLRGVDRGRRGGCGIRIVLALEDLGAVHVEARQARGRARRLRAHRLVVVLGARDDAADERDEQQDVDRREPRRRVHVEQAQVVEHRREVGVVDEVLA